MGRMLNIVTPLHQATKRDYLHRMTDDKVGCMLKAREYGADYWDGDRRYGYGGYRYIPGRRKPVAQGLIDGYGLKEDAKILDVGCGKGYLLYELKLLLPAARLVVYTQADLVSEGRRPALEPGALAVSATTGEGLDALLAAVRAAVPEGPFRHDGGDAGTQPLRFFAAEFIREAVFAALRQELPYAVAVRIDAFREEESGVYIRATLAVERESQKPIVLGKGGRTIKAIGTAARERIAALLGRATHLDLWVAVWPKWRSDPARLAELGLPLSKERER